MSKPPEHLAIIMDGNGRWAKARGHNRHYGHVRGAQVAKKIIEFCSRKGVRHLTLFTFSTENWFRPSTEVSFLMSLLQKQLHREKENLVKNKIRFRCVGEIERIPSAVRKIVENTTEATRHGTTMDLVMALSYSGRQELRKGFQKIAKQIESGQLKPSEVTDDVISQSLESSFLPDPDLIIRTSGESRISNFFLWQAAYSEIHFCDKYWPDFTEKDLLLSFERFSNSERRYGQLKENEKKTCLSNGSFQTPPSDDSCLTLKASYHRNDMTASQWKRDRFTSL